MSNLIPARHTGGMPLSTRSSSGHGAPPDWQQVQTLRVADVVMTILKARKVMPSAPAAAVSRPRPADGDQGLLSLLAWTLPPTEPTGPPHHTDRAHTLSS